ncbi:Chymotrypsin [Papilio machaon]|uniref:Chymotrypsin n=1 Tax=Papilio machaon TaxID=76193 RepID=A0A194RKI2_PAPMA|nr:Chymotrypsin [Papilio machaon]
MESFVVNGDFAKIKQYPHCVFLVVNCRGKWICGSSVINQKILLTAAHCLYCASTNPKIDAFAGHENIKQTSVNRAVKKVLIHDKYSDRNVNSDIGLVMLSEDLPLGKKIKRVILVKQSNYGLSAVVAGWGAISDEPERGTDTLKWANQKVRSEKTCTKLGKLKPGMMCAGSTSKEHPRPSKGDSGSALITANYQQIGIVSYRLVTYPGLVVYTNVSYYYDWIKEKSRLMYCG